MSVFGKPSIFGQTNNASTNAGGSQPAGSAFGNTGQPNPFGGSLFGGTQRIYFLFYDELSLPARIANNAGVNASTGGGGLFGSNNNTSGQSARPYIFCPHMLIEPKATGTPQPSGGLFGSTGSVNTSAGAPSLFGNMNAAQSQPGQGAAPPGANSSPFGGGSAFGSASGPASGLGGALAFGAQPAAGGGTLFGGGAPGGNQNQLGQAGQAGTPTGFAPAAGTTGLLFGSAGNTNTSGTGAAPSLFGGGGTGSTGGGLFGSTAPAATSNAATTSAATSTGPAASSPFNMFGGAKATEQSAQGAGAAKPTTSSCMCLFIICNAGFDAADSLQPATSTLYRSCNNTCNRWR
jgi:hypothetical protein